MIEWLVKKVLCSKVNGLLRKYRTDVDRFRANLKSWLVRINRITACLESLLAKLDDGEITSEEVKQASDDVTQVIKEW